MRFFAEQFTHNLLDLRNSGRSADKHNFVNVGEFYARIGQRLLARPDRALQNVINHRFELRPREFQVQMLRTGRIGRNERQCDLRLLNGGQFHLGFLRSFL